MKFGLTSNSINIITSLLGTFPKIEKAQIFGSRAMGNYKKGSDVDIALFGKMELDMVMKVNVILNEKLPLPYYFDVVAYALIEENELKAHIDQYGQDIYVKDSVDKTSD